MRHRLRCITAGAVGGTKQVAGRRAGRTGYDLFLILGSCINFISVSPPLRHHSTARLPEQIPETRASGRVSLRVAISFWGPSLKTQFDPLTLGNGTRDEESVVPFPKVFCTRNALLFASHLCFDVLRRNVLFFWHNGPRGGECVPPHPFSTPLDHLHFRNATQAPKIWRNETRRRHKGPALPQYDLSRRVEARWKWATCHGLPSYVHFSPFQYLFDVRIDYVTTVRLSAITCCSIAVSYLVILDNPGSVTYS